MAHLIVDGMNVIGSRPTGWWRDRDAAVRRLLVRLQRLRGATGAAVTVVFDGPRLPDVAEGVHGGVEVLYARRGGPDAADDRIVELVSGLKAPPRVYTSDRELRRRTATLGADVRGSAQLLADLDDLDQ